MKKLLALICVGVTAVVVTACSKSAPPAENEAAQPSQPAAAQPAAQPSQPAMKDEATQPGEPAGETTPPATDASQP